MYCHLENANTKLFQFENSDEYILIIFADCIVGKLEKLKTYDAKLFKGPIDGLTEIHCSTVTEIDVKWHITSDVGVLNVTEQTWQDKYHHMFKLLYVTDNAVFKQIDFKQETKNDKPFVLPKSKLYKVLGIDSMYFFVGFQPATFYTDKRGQCKKSKSELGCDVSQQGCTAYIYKGIYPTMTKIPSLDDYYPGQSKEYGPFTLVDDTASNLNLMTCEWQCGKTVYKLQHIKKCDNEELYKNIKLIHI